MSSLLTPFAIRAWLERKYPLCKVGRRHSSLPLVNITSLAQAMKADPCYLARVLKGKGKPSAQFIQRLAVVINNTSTDQVLEFLHYCATQDIKVTKMIKVRKATTKSKRK